MSLTRRLPSLDDRTYTGINSLVSQAITPDHIYGLEEDIKVFFRKKENTKSKYFMLRARDLNLDIELYESVLLCLSNLYYVMLKIF